MNQYIITEEELNRLAEIDYGNCDVAFRVIRSVRSHPYQSEQQPDRISCIHMQVCKFQTCTELCDYYCSLNSERDKFLKRMLECISQYEMLPNGMDFVIEDLLAELRQQAGEP
jgi:hypothetical protein